MYFITMEYYVYIFTKYIIAATSSVNNKSPSGHPAILKEEQIETIGDTILNFPTIYYRYRRFWSNFYNLENFEEEYFILTDSI